MDFLSYINELQTELTTQNIPHDKVRSIIAHESALAEIHTIDEQKSFFTSERLKNVLAKATQTNETTPISPDSDTIAPQSSSSKHSVRILDDNKTIMPTAPRATIQSLADEATMIVISGSANHAIEEQTIAAPPNLKKLLSNHDVVKISEKDTAFFQSNTSTSPQKNIEDATVQVRSIGKTFIDTEATLPRKTRPQNIPFTEQTRPMPSHTTVPIKEAKVTTNTETPKKEAVSTQTSPNHTPPQTAIPLSPETLRNPHPRIAFFWLTFLLIPSICILTVLVASLVAIINLIFVVAFAVVMLSYLTILLFPAFIAIYSSIFAFLYWQDGHTIEGFIETGITLFTSGLSLLLGYLLYRHFVVATEMISEKCKSFNQKNFILIRNLYRFSVKGAEKL